MPLYDYDCLACGPFEAARAMIDFAGPAPCPACGEAAPRALSVPGLRVLDPARRLAHSTNEASAHAPRRSGGVHSSGCKCCSSRPKTKSAGSRPWMISH